MPLRTVGIRPERLAEPGRLQPLRNWCPTDPAGDDTHTWSGNYALNIHVNNSPGTNQFRSWDGASWVLAQADPRASGPSIYGWRTPLDGVGLKTAQWEDPGGTIFLLKVGETAAGRERGDRGSYWWTGAPLAACFNSGDVQCYDPPNLAITIWQEKHRGKANLTFCDGHAAAMYMRNTVAEPTSEYGFVDERKRNVDRAAGTETEG